MQSLDTENSNLKRLNEETLKTTEDYVIPTYVAKEYIEDMLIEMSELAQVSNQSDIATLLQMTLTIIRCKN